MPLSADDVTFDDIAEDVEEEEAKNTEDEEKPENSENENQGEDLDVDDEDVDDLESFGDEDLDEAFGQDEDEEPQDEDSEQPEDEEDSEEADETEETEEVSFVQDLGSQFGLPEDELEEYDDTWDDALEVARKGAETMAQQEINNFFEKYPDVREYTEYRVNGGDPDAYQEEVLNAPSYDELELEGNESTQERVVREKLQEVEGLSDEKVDSRVERYKSAGILKSEAEDAKEILSEKQEERREQLVEKQKKQAEKRRQEQLEKQKEFKQTIRESDNLGGLRLPENQKDDFESYLFEPVNEEGHTQAQLDYQEMGEEEALSLYYLMFQGGPQNLGDLVDNKASTKQAEKISDKLSKTSSRDVKDKSSSQNKGDRRKNSDPNLEGFDLDSAIG